MPFSRPELKQALIEAYRPMDIALHPIMFQDEATDWPEPWIFPVIIPGSAATCKVPMPGTFKRNWFMRNCGIIDDDYYLAADDDDMYEPGVFDAIKKMDDDIVIISMKRGNNVPDDAPPARRYPTDTLYARPEFVQVGMISSQQSFVKGRIFKAHPHNEESHNGDGEMAVHYKESGEQIAYRPDLFALFNYYEPGRWAERKKMISIVIPVYNQHPMTADCIKAIYANTQDYEIIIVDNGSEPPICEPFTTIRNETNLGFPAAVNQGIRAAKGDTIILLNNDVIVTPHWADRLLHHLNNYAIVGTLTNYCAGMQFEMIPTYQDEQELHRISGEWATEHAGETQEVNWVIGFCMAFKKALFDEIGLFDTSLWPCCGEEIDFCFRAREAGYRIGIARDIYVHHAGSLTFLEMHNAGQLDHVAVNNNNDAHLTKKWGKDFWFRQAVAA